jgi:UDP-N-acetylmuramoylalanine--D-glutamate ligase
MRCSYENPGIPEKSGNRQEAGRKGIPVISEIEFAAPFTNAIW